MRLALDEAFRASERGEVPIGAVVVAGGRIIGRGHNLVETLTDPTAHAEMQAITAATAELGGKYLTDCTLYVTLEPCPMCAAAMGWAQLGRLVYGADDEKRGFSTFFESRRPAEGGERAEKKLLHPKTEVTRGVLAEECAAPIKKFFQNRRN